MTSKTDRLVVAVYAQVWTNEMMHDLNRLYDRMLLLCRVCQDSIHESTVEEIADALDEAWSEVATVKNLLDGLVRGLRADAEGPKPDGDTEPRKVDPLNMPLTEWMFRAEMAEAMMKVLDDQGLYIKVKTGVGDFTAGLKDEDFWDLGTPSEYLDAVERPYVAKRIWDESHGGIVSIGLVRTKTGREEIQWGLNH